MSYTLEASRADKDMKALKLASVSTFTPRPLRF